MAITKKSDSFEFKDRVYILKGNQPVTFVLNVKHSENNPLQYFDPIEQRNRSIRYATNQKSPFEDEQEGFSTLGKAIFEDGTLKVPKENIVLQKILSIYHPYKGIKYEEFDPNKEAEAELEELDLVFEAQKTIRENPIEDNEAIARVLWKGKVATMSSGEMKRDLLVYAKSNPKEILALASDESIKLRNLAIRAVESGLLALTNDNRTFIYNDKTKTKIIDVDFGKNPYSELASYFKTDEGIDVMKNIVNKLK